MESKKIFRASLLRVLCATLMLSGVAQVACARDYVMKMKRLSGVYTIQCEVNGVKKDFIFDTGAAHTSLSQEFVNELLARRKLSRSDFKGTTQTRNASGVIDNNATVLLKQLRVGNRMIHNVTAVVAVSQKAPLLLGLNAIDLIGEWSIRNGYLILHEYNQQSQPLTSTITPVDGNIENNYDSEFVDSEMNPLPSKYDYPIEVNILEPGVRVSAYRGDAEAQYIVGISYLVGDGVEADHKIAVVWLRMAAMQGHRLAQLALADCLDNGWGVDVDHEHAELWRDYPSQE